MGALGVAMGAFLCGPSAATSRDTVRRNNSFKFFEVGSLRFAKPVSLTVDSSPSRRAAASQRLRLSSAYSCSRRAARTKRARHALSRSRMCHHSRSLMLPLGRQLSYTSFARMFRLELDQQTQTLCKTFDSDCSGSIGFREFVYGLSKFSEDSFDSELRFAFRLFDLDGSGSLEKHEAILVLREAMNSDLSQYGAKALPEKFDSTQRDIIRQLVDQISTQTGKDNLGWVEFQMICTRAPRIYQPARFLFQLMNRFSKYPYRVVESLSPDALKTLVTGIGRTQLEGNGKLKIGFDSDQMLVASYKGLPKRLVEPQKRTAQVLPDYAALLHDVKTPPRRPAVPGRTEAPAAAPAAAAAAAAMARPATPAQAVHAPGSQSGIQRASTVPVRPPPANALPPRPASAGGRAPNKQASRALQK